jgi:hypothetical protein
VGDQYRLVFVTSSSHQATSSVISTYNTIVDDLGDNAIESDWKVIGSTADDHAIDNTETPIATTGVSIWRLDGVKVADDYADFWDGSLIEPINMDEEQINPPFTDAEVWTGTLFEGWEGTQFTLGEDNPTFGLNIYDLEYPEDWLAYDLGNPTDEHRLYGMSGVLTVPAAAVPEPSSAILLGMGVGVGWIRFRRKRRQASSTV